MPRIKEFIEKYLKNKKYSLVFILLAAGLLLVFFSSVKPHEKTAVVKEDVKIDMEKLRRDTEKELSDFLLCADGIDFCRVMISYKDKGTTVYSENSITSSEKEESKKESSVVLRREGGNEFPLEERYIAPEIKGVTVIVRGGFLSEEKIAKAVSRAIGVEIHNVEVIINERN